MNLTDVEVERAITYMVNQSGGKWTEPVSRTKATPPRSGKEIVETQCVKCHGTTNESWKAPLPRDHPTEQGLPVRVWRAACVTCHDAASTVAHADTYTSAAGVESCADCHGPGTSENVELVHKVR